MKGLVTTLLSVSLLLTGCAAQMPKTAQTAGNADQTAAVANDSLYATLWQQTALEHDLVYAEIYRDAREKLPRALHDRQWDALPHEERESVRHGHLRGLKPAIILDVDETVLDNSPYQARQIRAGKTSFDPVAWNTWCKQAIARPLAGTLAFTRYAAARGVRVIYISNRDQALNQATLMNLRKAGFPVADDNALLGLGMKIDDCEQHGSDKGCRRKLIAHKYRVLMEFGDQVGDFVDVRSNTTGGRESAVEPYRDWIGERWFVLPNPVYGSWQSAVYDGAKTPQQQRAAEHAALRVQ